MGCRTIAIVHNNKLKEDIKISRVFFISDLHIAHKNILKFRDTGAWEYNGKPITTVQEHDLYLKEAWNSVVGKRDTVYVLGDVCFDVEAMSWYKEVNGNKNLILGNHDKFDIGVYQKYFSSVKAFRRYKGYWISHCPIHPQELRGNKNIHGHVHTNDIRNEYHDCYNDEFVSEVDDEYVNVCVENLPDSRPILFTDIVAATGGGSV